jgi:sulfopyruvate decarboxylase TPP-binding subunit
MCVRIVVVMKGFGLEFRFMLLERKQIAVFYEACAVAGRAGMMLMRIAVVGVVMSVFAALRRKTNRLPIMMMMGKIVHGNQHDSGECNSEYGQTAFRHVLDQKLLIFVQR